MPLVTPVSSYLTVAGGPGSPWLVGFGHPSGPNPICSFEGIQRHQAPPASVEVGHRNHAGCRDHLGILWLRYRWCQLKPVLSSVTVFSLLLACCLQHLPVVGLVRTF